MRKQCFNRHCFLHLSVTPVLYRSFDTLDDLTRYQGDQQTNYNAQVDGQVPHSLFVFKFLEDTYAFLLDYWYSFFGLLVTSPPGFKARVCSFIRTWWRRVWCTFTSGLKPTDLSMASMAASLCSPHACFSNGGVPDSKGKPPTQQSNLLDIFIVRIRSSYCVQSCLSVCSQGGPYLKVHMGLPPIPHGPFFHHWPLHFELVHFGTPNLKGGSWLCG